MEQSETCVVYLLGYPGMGKRTIGSHLAPSVGGVLVDNALLSRPVLELFDWDGKFLLPPEVWGPVEAIRDVVLGAIEDLAPASNSYVFTNVLEEHPQSWAEYAQVRDLAARRGSLFLAVLLTCDIDVQVSRIDNADRVALRKGSDPEAYRRHRLEARLLQPPPEECLTLDTTVTTPDDNAARIHDELRRRGLRRSAQVAGPRTSGRET